MTTPGKPTIRIQTVTPALADKWLASNTLNYRKLKEPQVLKLVGILQRGEWKLVPDCIAFDTNGKLMNGQHRLAAIVTAEIAAEVGVMRGLEPEAEDVMDGILLRRLYDTLHNRGEHDVNNLAAALRWLYRFELIERNIGEGNSTGVTTIPPEHQPTTPVLLRVLEENPDIRESVKATAQHKRLLRLKGVAAACHYRMKQINSAECDMFWDLLMTGEGLEARDPILVLRKMLITDASSTISRARMKDWKQAGMLCLAWNHWRAGEEKEKLKWSWGAAVKMPFPIPK